FLDAATKEVLKRRPHASEANLRAEVAKMTVGVEISDSRGELLHLSGQRGRARVIFSGLSIAPDVIFLDTLTDMAVINLGRVVGPPFPIIRHRHEEGKSVYGLGFPAGPESLLNVSTGRVIGLPEPPKSAPDFIVNFYRLVAIDADLESVS